MSASGEAEAPARASNERLPGHAPPPRRLRRSVRVIFLMTLTFSAALVVSHGGDGAGGWWTAFLSLAALAATRTVHTSQVLRLVTLLLGACVPVALLAGGTSRSVAELLLSLGVAGLVAPFALALLGWAVGEMLDALRTGWTCGPRVFLGLACALAALAATTVALSLAPPPDAADRLITAAAVVQRIDAADGGEQRVTGGWIHCWPDEGALSCGVDPATPTRSSRRLPTTFEEVRVDGRAFLRPVGSRDVASWSAVDLARGVLRAVEPNDAPEPRRASRSLTLSLAIAGLLALGLLVRAAHLARQRRRVVRGIDGIADGSGVTAGSQRFALALQPGPVVLLDASGGDGAYRQAPGGSAQAWLAGTRRGRVLRLDAELTRTSALVALVLAYPTVAAVVALASGSVLAPL